MRTRENLEKIFIRDLSLRCVIGVQEEERREKQDILINIVLYANLRKACQNDDLAGSLDYKSVKHAVMDVVERSSSHLIEHLAEQIAQACLQKPLVQKVTVMIDKPGALRFARSVAVEITRQLDE